MYNVFVAGVFTAFATASAVAAVSPSATIVGTVTLTTADGDTFAGDGVRVVLACGTERATRTDVADEHGAFRFLNVPVDSCSIEADVQGFVAAPVMVVTAAGETLGTDVHLGIAALRVGVNVSGTASSLAPKMLRRSCWSDAGRPREGLASKCTR
jgi:hypothetical protein